MKIALVTHAVCADSGSFAFSTVSRILFCHLSYSVSSNISLGPIRSFLSCARLALESAQLIRDFSARVRRSGSVGRQGCKSVCRAAP